MKKFKVEEAQEQLEYLMAMAFNGELVIICHGKTLVKLEPIAERVVPNKIYTAVDFYED